MNEWLILGLAWLAVNALLAVFVLYRTYRDE